MRFEIWIDGKRYHLPARVDVVFGEVHMTFESGSPVVRTKHVRDGDVHAEKHVSHDDFLSLINS